VLDPGVLAHEHLDRAGVEVEGVEPRRRTPLDVVDLRTPLGDDHLVGELAAARLAHPEVGVDREVDGNVLGDVDERPAGPERAVKRGEPVGVRRDRRHEVLANQVGVLPDGRLHAAEDHPLVGVAILDRVVDRLRVGLRAGAGEGVPFGLGDPEPFVRLAEGLGEVAPGANGVFIAVLTVSLGRRFHVGANVRDHLADVDRPQVRLPGPVGHREVGEPLQGVQAVAEHPLGFVLGGRDIPSRVLEFLEVDAEVRRFAGPGGIGVVGPPLRFLGPSDLPTSVPHVVELEGSVAQNACSALGTDRTNIGGESRRDKFFRMA